MKYEFSKTDTPANNSSISLNTVYKLDADMSYNVTKNVGIQDESYIALRTIKGQGKVLLEGYSEKIVETDTLLFFQLNKVKKYYCSDNTWKFWWFEFKINTPLLFLLNTVLRINQIPYEEEICQSCLDLIRFKQKHSLSLASSKLSLLLHEWMYQTQYESHSREPHYDNINFIVQYLHMNISKNIKVSSMASMCNLSERRFRQVFKAHTGNQPKIYFENIKLSLAKELLLNTSLSIGEIANKLGYKNQFYFSRVFTEKFSASPSIFRINNGL